MTPGGQQVTQLLRAWSGGDRQALDDLMPLVYDQLRQLAARCLSNERPHHTLRATALVNEAYLRLAGSDMEFNDRIHFYAVAARMLRHILVDHAKSQARSKRGGGVEKVSFDEAVLVGPGADSGIVELDEALERLGARDARKARVIELLFFGGLTHEETAAALEVSTATVDRELRMAKAWLHRELTPKS